MLISVRGIVVTVDFTTLTVSSVAVLYPVYDMTMLYSPGVIPASVYTPLLFVIAEYTSDESARFVAVTRAPA